VIAIAMHVLIQLIIHVLKIWNENCRLLKATWTVYYSVRDRWRKHNLWLQWSAGNCKITWQLGDCWLCSTQERVWHKFYTASDRGERSNFTPWLLYHYGNSPTYSV